MKAILSIVVLLVLAVPAVVYLAPENFRQHLPGWVNSLPGLAKKKVADLANSVPGLAKKQDPLSRYNELCELSREDWQIDVVKDLCTEKGVGTFIAMPKWFREMEAKDVVLKSEMKGENDDRADVAMLSWKPHGIDAVPIMMVRPKKDGKWKFHSFWVDDHQ